MRTFMQSSSHSQLRVIFSKNGKPREWSSQERTLQRIKTLSIAAKIDHDGIGVTMNRRWAEVLAINSQLYSQRK